MTAESSGPVTEIMMPTWTPGSYMIREYARNIDRIEATDGHVTGLEYPGDGRIVEHTMDLVGGLDERVDVRM